ncbi:hypothetical protein B0T18DRAFT_431188 [Schizothecium vesticola]|uniref:Uncharacterized protein n=1 Tax=Schizothecium vesticola TaxID=314040 RepID=A0AA40ERE7_9PEZI|nr:hypothetical protein B0T18DRAFT_431188 [Schizothecium vesticola]
MTVNSTGANVLPEPHKKSIVTKRTPPAKAGSYQDFQFDLSFEPAANGDACIKGCSAAFSEFASTCAASAPGVFMYEKGPYEIGCGTLADYAIRKDNKTSFVQTMQTYGGVPYQHKIWWKEGCRVEKNGGPTALLRADLLPQGRRSGTGQCSNMLWSN